MELNGLDPSGTRGTNPTNRSRVRNKRRRAVFDVIEYFKMGGANEKLDAGARRALCHVRL